MGICAMDLLIFIKTFNKPNSEKWTFIITKQTKFCPLLLAESNIYI